VAFICSRSDVEVIDANVDAGRAVVPGIRCGGLPGLTLEAGEHLTSAAPLADGPGLMFFAGAPPGRAPTLRRGI
jgi:hypothetical protein